MRKESMVILRRFIDGNDQFFFAGRFPGPLFEENSEPGKVGQYLSGRDHLVRIQHKLLSGAFIEILISIWRFVQRNRSYVYRLGDLNLVIENRHHELPVILQYRALT